MLHTVQHWEDLFWGDEGLNRFYSSEQMLDDIWNYRYEPIYEDSNGNDQAIYCTLESGQGD